MQETKYVHCVFVINEIEKQHFKNSFFPPHLGRWQFATQSADIGFGVFLKDKKGEWKKATQMQEVVLSQRYNSHLVPEDGSLTCERPGVCEWAATPSIGRCSEIFITVCKSSIENVVVYLPQMFCDLTTLTASSKLKESASLLRSCSLTTCSPRRQMGHPKTLCKLRATAIHN